MQGRYRALWLNEEGYLEVIDQRFLPFEKRTLIIKSAQQCARAIKNMTVRGAGVIGNTAAFGVYLAARQSSGKIEEVRKEAKNIRESRPTAVNLMWAVDRMLEVAEKCTASDMAERLKKEAVAICDEDVVRCRSIGKTGADIFEKIMKEKNRNSINILTHCNAGWLAIVDDGSALAPIYELHRRGVDVHVWVDETRPRNQGANLTAWELSEAGIKHTVIADNTGGHLMQHGMVDVCITGADRVSLSGDVANKIGTYLKALAAKDNKVPFYVALPASTFDFSIEDGLKQIPIETRSEDEVKFIRGRTKSGSLEEVQIVPDGSRCANYGFDVTPARLITGLITERGVCEAKKEAIAEMFGDIL
ncbi:S-methyl-5-thioribose-1-phosphate isomerase [Nitrosophilus alvini]|uniref:S-methyl-5-thioribose-1-phosphate isomerase n=1 Tax=Nitrosophilus alvini TaxID=2714855 RepID=UPI001909AF04|nr:S-methyl-5-thioribose-1-phosphate isomerase [Nitrosophilus alvini]